MGYFKVDYDVKGKAVTASDTAVRLHLAGKFSPDHVHIMSLSRIVESALIENFSARINEQYKLRDSMAQLKAGDFDSGKKELANAAIANSEALIKAFDEFNKVVTSVPQGKTYSLLASAVMRDYLMRLEVFLCLP